MAQPSEKLADSLEALRALQERGIVAIRSKDLSRTHRERLRKNGYLKEVLKGWYIPARPDETAGESTAWYAAYWDFCAAYLTHRFDEDWCLAPEQSLRLHVGNWSVPRQLLVRSSSKARNNVTALPHGTSLLDVRTTVPGEDDIEAKRGLRLFSLATALIACAPGSFTQNPTDTRAALAMIRGASEVLPKLLDGGHSKVAGRLAGAFRNIGRTRIADEILATMRKAGFTVRENDPFDHQAPLLFSARERSPYVNRIRLMWHHMREPVIERFPAAPGRPDEREGYLQRVEEIYVTDAYHSLSIEGYRVSPALIDRVRQGGWDPENKPGDREHDGALAARGYWQAYQAVRESVAKVLAGNNPGTVADDDHGTWYREMFAPRVAAGILRPSDLAGYRNGPVHIRRSKHVPTSREAVRDLMPAFFDLLREEEAPSVRVVLGHFIFVYVHPYMDGNGRMARFLMNVMLAAAGYPWTVIPMEERNPYIEALEDASVGQDIRPFAEFLGGLVERGLRGEPAPPVPAS